MSIAALSGPVARAASVSGPGTDKIVDGYIKYSGGASVAGYEITFSDLTNVANIAEALELAHQYSFTKVAGICTLSGEILINPTADVATFARLNLGDSLKANNFIADNNATVEILNISPANVTGLAFQNGAASKYMELSFNPADAVGHTVKYVVKYAF